MPNPNQIIGRAKVKVNGATLPTAGDVTLDLGGTKREPQNGDYEVGFKTGPAEPAKLEASYFTKPGFSAADFGRIEDATILVEFDTGRSYMIAHGCSEGPAQITSSDGKAKGVLYGEPAVEVA